MMIGNRDSPDEFVEPWKPELLQPEEPDPGAVERLKLGLRQLQGRSSVQTRARGLMVSPIPATIAVIALVAIGFLLGRVSVSTNGPAAKVDRTTWSGPATRTVHFVLVAEHANRVNVVGDFNDWDPEANALERQANGVWSAEITLPSGRHEYVFLVDGQRWLADRSAPRSPEDEFGVSNSVILVQAREP